MNAIGVNTWIWVSPLTDQRLSGLAPKIQSWGFDLIELPVEEPSDWDPARARELLDGLGLAVSTCAVMTRERDPAAAIRGCAGRLAHFHACGCDRGAPGNDQIGWPAIAAALHDVGYDGAIVIESFTVENQTIARAAAIWRALAVSQDAIAIDGLHFLRGLRRR